VIASLLVVIRLANGIDEFHKEKVKLDTWSNWQNEVTLWKKKPKRWLNIWPAPWRTLLPNPEKIE
jgi:hypothetical protein